MSRGTALQFDSARLSSAAQLAEFPAGSDISERRSKTGDMDTRTTISIEKWSKKQQLNHLLLDGKKIIWP